MIQTTRPVIMITLLLFVPNVATKADKVLLKRTALLGCLGLGEKASK